MLELVPGNIHTLHPKNDRIVYATRDENGKLSSIRFENKGPALTAIWSAMQEFKKQWTLVTIKEVVLDDPK